MDVTHHSPTTTSLISVILKLIHGPMHPSMHKILSSDVSFRLTFSFYLILCMRPRSQGLYHT